MFSTRSYCHMASLRRGKLLSDIRSLSGTALACSKGVGYFTRGTVLGSGVIWVHCCTLGTGGGGRPIEGNGQKRTSSSAVFRMKNFSDYYVDKQKLLPTRNRSITVPIKRQSDSASIERSRQNLRIRYAACQSAESRDQHSTSLNQLV